MNETLHEYVSSRGVKMRVDRQQGLIRGVKILGLESRNGRSYLPEALASAAPLYEEAKVNVNHPKGDPLTPRDYQDRLGVIRGVTVRPDGLFGDLHFNPKHALAEQLLWDAEHAPENVGLSHNVQARTSRRGDRVVVEAITRVQSVDLVADPATTRGLFETLAAESQTAGEAESAAPPADDCSAAELADAVRLAIAALTLEDLHRERPDLIEALVVGLVEVVWPEVVERRAELEHQRSPRPLGAAPLSREQQRVEGEIVESVKRFVEAIT